MALFPRFNAWIIFHCEPISHNLIHSFFLPCILSLLSSLGTWNAATEHALGCVIFKICVFLKCSRSEKAISYFLSLSLSLSLSLCLIEAPGQWFLSWLLPLICPHFYKRIPLTNGNLPFLVWIVFHGGLFQCSDLTSHGSLDFTSLVLWHWDTRCIQLCLFSPAC